MSRFDLQEKILAAMTRQARRSMRSLSASSCSSLSSIDTLSSFCSDHSPASPPASVFDASDSEQESRLPVQAGVLFQTEIIQGGATRVLGKMRRKRNPEKEAGRLAKRQKINPRNRG